MTEAMIKSGVAFTIIGKDSIYRYDSECLEYAVGCMNGQWIAHVDFFNSTGFYAKSLDQCEFIDFNRCQTL